MLGFFALNVHWIDIGGVMHGSTDIFMGGLQLRTIKLWSKGAPVEEIYRIIENNTRMPVDVKFRGGLGFRKEYEILHPCTLNTNLDRRKYPPWGVRGGNAAKPGCVTIIKADGETETMGKAQNYKLQPGDRVILETGGGGGWGPPEERAVESIQRDLDRGYITAQGAVRDYGVRVEAGRVMRG